MLNERPDHISVAIAADQGGGGTLYDFTVLIVMGMILVPVTLGLIAARIFGPKRTFLVFSAMIAALFAIFVPIDPVEPMAVIAFRVVAVVTSVIFLLVAHREGRRSG